MRFSILIIILVIASPQTLQSQSPKRPINYKNAVSLYKKENFKAAKNMFQVLSERDSANLSLHYYLGACNIMLQDYQAGLKNFEKIYLLSKGTPDRVEDLYYLAYLCHTLHQFEKAIHLYSVLLTRMIRTGINFINLINSQDELDAEDIRRRIKQCRYAEVAITNPVAVKIERLGAAVNTEWSEVKPLIAPDEQTLIFTSQRPECLGSKTRTGLPPKDIFITRKQPDGRWRQAQPIDQGIVNSVEDEAAIAASSDGNTLITYVTHLNFRHKPLSNLYIVKRINGAWTKPELLPNTINSKHRETAASMTADNQRLFFVSDRPGGIGGKDIYFSQLSESGYWQEAINLGRDINTKEHEEAPYINATGNVLRFASLGHENMGGFDLFFSEYNAESDKWSVPANLGYPINTSADERDFSWTADGVAYFASTRPDSKGYQDIYRLTLLEK